MKTPKKPKLYDVHIMRSNKAIDSRVFWISTENYSLPYLIARSKVRIIDKDKNQPKGTFGLALPNGTSPIEYLQNIKNKIK